MLPVLLCLVLACAVAVAPQVSPAQTQSPQTEPPDKPNMVSPDAVKGCYDLELSPWRPNLNIGRDAVFITPPRRVQLLAERGTKGWEAEGFIARPAPGVRPSIHSGSFWLPTGPRSIRIVWTTGFSGLEMHLTLEPPDLRGTAASFWDFDREHQTADVVAHLVDCGNEGGSSAAEPTQSETKTAQADCHEDSTPSTIVAGVGWGPVHIGAAFKDVDAFLGEGEVTSRYRDSYFKDYTQKGVQVLFESADGTNGTVRAIFFYNRQRDHDEFATFCGDTNKNINWRSSVEDVKKAYGQPTEEFSGTDTGGSWNRIVFAGIDFRFENKRMVTIGVPGR